MNKPTTSFNFWPWSPVFIIGAAAIANTVLFILAKDVRPQKVEAQPYVASSRIDSEKLASQRFSERGWSFVIQAHSAQDITLTITGNTAAIPARLLFYRPASEADDHELAWADCSKPLAHQLPKGGMWRVRFIATDEQQQELRSETAIDSIAMSRPR
jgi:nitrogen fixation protein FixH